MRRELYALSPPRWSEPPVTGRALMPWISSGLAVHQVAYAAPLPHTMPAVSWPKEDGKTCSSASNQYWAIDSDSVVSRKVPRSRSEVSPVAEPHRTRAALSASELDALFDLAYHTKHVDTIFARVFGKA